MALAAVVLASPGLESLIPRFCNRRVVLPPEIIPALDTAASALSTGSRTPTLLSGAGNEQEKPPSRLVPHTVVWLGTPHHKKGQEKCFETWRLDAAVVPIHSHVAAKDRAGLTLEVPSPAPERNQSRAGTAAGCQLLTHTSKPFCITWEGGVLSPCSMLHQISMYATERGRRSLRTKSLYPATAPEGCCAGKRGRTCPSRELPRVPPGRTGVEALGFNLEGCHSCSACHILMDAAGDRT